MVPSSALPQCPSEVLAKLCYVRVGFLLVPRVPDRLSSYSLEEGAIGAVHHGGVHLKFPRSRRP